MKKKFWLFSLVALPHDYRIAQISLFDQNLFLMLPIALAEDSPISIQHPAMERKIKQVIRKEAERDWRTWSYRHYRNWQALQPYDLLPHSNSTHE